ncbi:carboxypeptidase-like regulatory domain-containing protein [Mesoflavibacter zeaxanthinifaciens]|uniref:carboxypeptidase-like regulatory domain-containing protein n=1 Tax=Mesoflavibacter zeaxanthinifaciens TaxID=393060 RepID=UPI0026E996BC|nr:carboxypeptidase-like regulatory domain-containing protein [Mesoflavibacter zeaxanthinifaciens]
MNNAIKLNIKSPCSEDFNQFKPTAKGGFCTTCTKDVIDFSKMNSEDIINYFNTKNTTNTCGRFKSEQLTTYQIPVKRNKLSWLTGIGLACLSFFTFGTTNAQVKTTENNTIESASSKENLTIKGTITDQDGIPLPSANVLLEGTSIGTATDFDGNFEFPQKLKKGDVLQISYVGYEPKKVVIDSKSKDQTIQLNINMIVGSVIMMGKVSSKKLYKSKKD